MKTGHHAQPDIERLITGRQLLQAEQLPALLRSIVNSIRHRQTQQLFHWPGPEAIAGQIAFIRVPLQQSLPLEVAADALLSEGLRQPGQLHARRHRHPAESERTVGPLDIRPVSRDIGYPNKTGSWSWRFLH
jgi:hypothetical protein